MIKSHRVLGLPLVVALVVLAACMSATSDSTTVGQLSSSAASSSVAPTEPGTGPPGPAPIGELPAAAAAIMAKPEFKTARWIYAVSDPKTGEVLLANRPDELVFTASTAKNFTVGSVYAAVGPDATLTTPVYATAAPVDGVVDGDLVLVASGDLALGGRGAMEGRVDHTFTATTIDHVYGDVAPNATLVPDDPLAGLDDLARQVKAAGITTVAHDVTIDTRIWNTFEGQEGPAPSIFVNDNILDITVMGGAAGEPATLDLRPETSAITVTSSVTTTEASTPTALQVTPSPSDPTAITVSGTIAAERVAADDLPRPRRRDVGPDALRRSARPSRRQREGSRGRPQRRSVPPGEGQLPGRPEGGGPHLTAARGLRHHDLEDELQHRRQRHDVPSRR